MTNDFEVKVIPRDANERCTTETCIYTGDPGYSFGSSINHDYDTNSELVVVENNEYKNNYNNTDLSLDVKNEVFKDLGSDKYQDKGFFNNVRGFNL